MTRSLTTTTPSAVCVTWRTGVDRCTRSPSACAMRNDIDCAPSTNRRSCAPPGHVDEPLEGAGRLLVAGAWRRTRACRAGRPRGPRAEDGVERGGGDLAGLRHGRVGPQPGVEGLAVPLLGVGCRPRARRPAPAPPSRRAGSTTAPGRPGSAGRAVPLRSGRRWRRCCAGRRGVDVVALVVLGEGLQAELVGERRDGVLRRPDPGAAEVGRVPVAQRRVERAAADAVAGLEDEDAATGGGQRGRRVSPARPGTDDATSAVSRVRLRRGRGGAAGAQRGGACGAGPHRRRTACGTEAWSVLTSRGGRTGYGPTTRQRRRS